MIAPALDPAAQGWSVRDDEPGLISLIGPLWEKREGERMLRGFLADERHVNRRGVVHGGAMMAFADQALGLVAWEAAGGVPQATIQLDTHFVAAVRPGDFVVAEAEVVRKTRSIVFTSGRFLVDGEVVLRAQGVWKLLKG